MLLKQPLDFPVVEKIQTIDRLAIIQFQNIVETTVGFFSKRID